MGKTFVVVYRRNETLTADGAADDISRFIGYDEFDKI